MRKLLFSLFSLLALLFSSTTAQVKDAFQGILPVTDPQMKQSLNGVWDLKVVEGITDDLSVPTLDETWSKIDVPGCWEAYGLCKPSMVMTFGSMAEERVPGDRATTRRSSTSRPI